MPGKKNLRPSDGLDDAARRRAERTALASNIRRSSPRTSAVSSSVDSTAGPAKGAFTGRLLIVLTLVLFSMFLLAPQLKVYMKQRQEVAELKADIENQKLQKERLTKETQRLNDDAYIRQQARDRLFMVMPGETRYMVTGSLPAQGEAVQGSAASQKQRSWSESYTDAIRLSAR